jgi:hypothetical protein
MMDTASTAIGAIALGAVGAWAIVEHRPIGSQVMLGVILVIVGGRKLTASRRASQTSSTSRP